MPPPSSDRKLVSSILDRLIDLSPRVSTEAPSDAGQALAQVKKSVKRDLEWLLNAKRTVADLPAELGHLEQSLLTYGLPDFTASSLVNRGDQDALRGAIAEAVRRFEPRLTAVSVTLAEGNGHDRTLRFQIDALLRAEPLPVAVTFDSTLKLHNRAFEVRDDG